MLWLQMNDYTVGGSNDRISGYNGDMQSKLDNIVVFETEEMSSKVATITLSYFTRSALIGQRSCLAMWCMDIVILIVMVMDIIYN